MGCIVYVNDVSAEVEIQLIQIWPVILIKDYDGDMNRTILLMMISILWTAISSGCSWDSMGLGNEAHADQATNFTLSSLDGESVSLESLRGQYVLVNFWATWCVPCRKEMPYLQALSDNYPERLIVLGINMREDAARIQPFVDEMGLSFPILLEPTDEILLEHNVRGLPVTFVVDPGGKVVYRELGEVQPEEFNQWLEVNVLMEDRP